jgi:hypothetical protein
VALDDLGKVFTEFMAVDRQHRNPPTNLHRRQRRRCARRLSRDTLGHGSDEGFLLQGWLALNEPIQPARCASASIRKK